MCLMSHRLALYIYLCVFMCHLQLSENSRTLSVNSHLISFADPLIYIETAMRKVAEGSTITSLQPTRKSRGAARLSFHLITLD